MYKIIKQKDEQIGSQKKELTQRRIASDRRVEEISSSNNELLAKISDMKAEELLTQQAIETLNSKLEETESRVSNSNKASTKSKKKLEVLGKELIIKGKLLNETTAKLSDLQAKELCNQQEI